MVANKSSKIVSKRKLQKFKDLALPMNTNGEINIKI